MATKNSFREIGIKTAKGGTVYIIGEGFTSFLSLIVIVYLARMLQPSDFGLYIISIAFAFLLGMGGNFGIGTALRKKLPEAKNKAQSNRIMSNGYIIAGGISIIIALLGIILSSSIANIIYHNSSLSTPIAIASASVFFSVLFNITMASLVGIGKVRISVYSNVLYSISQLIIIVILVSSGYGVLGAMTGYLLSLIIGLLFGAATLLRRGAFKLEHVSATIIKELSSFSLPVVISNIINIGISNFGVVFLGVFVASAIVGNYGAASRIGNIVNIFVTSGTFLLLPAYAMVISHKKHNQNISSAYENSVYYTLLFLLPIVAFSIAGAQPLLKLLVSSKYSLAPIYFSIIAAGLTIGVIGTYAGSILIGFGRTKKFMKYQIYVAIVELGLLIALTPIFNAYGVLFSVFIFGPIFSAIIYTRLLKREFLFNINYKRSTRLAICATILFVLLSLTTYATMYNYYSLLLDIIVTIIVYPIILIVFRGIGAKEISFIEETSKRMVVINRFSSVFIKYIHRLFKFFG